MKKLKFDPTNKWYMHNTDIKKNSKNIHHHHRIALPARISLTFVRHPFYRPSLSGRLQGYILYQQELLFIGSNWSSFLCSSMWRGPQVYVVYEFVPTSPTTCLVPVTWIVFVMGWPYLYCFVGTVTQTPVKNHQIRPVSKTQKRK